MPTVRFGYHPAAHPALALGLLLAAACSNDRPTEAGTGAGPEFTAASVDCANGCKDTFTDADGTPLTAHAPDVGGFTWSLVEGFNHVAEIRNNAVGVEGTDTVDKQFHYLIPEVVGLDGVELEVELFSDTATIRGTYTAFITLRGDGSPLGGYRVWVQIFGDARAFVGFDRNNEPLPLAGSGKEIPPLTKGIHKLRAEAAGGTLKAYVDGVLVNSVTDPSPLPAGNPGFGLDANIAFSGFDSEVRITTFEVIKALCPTGDTILDSKAMRDLMKIAWDSSNALDANKLNRRERAGYVIRDAAGNLEYRTFFAGTDTPCQAFNTPTGIPIGSFVAEFHTHPFTHLEETTGICRPAVPGVKSYYHAKKYGGPSEADLNRGNNDQLPMYILDKDNIYFFPVGTTKTNWNTKVKKYSRIDPTGCVRP